MQTYLVVGGSSGIGKSVVKSLRDSGNRVYYTFKSHDMAQDVDAVELDVLNQEFNPSFLPDRLDGLVYCPGSIDLKPFTKLSEDTLIDDLRLQVGGAVQVLQAVLPRLKASDKASVVFFSSVAVQTGFNYHSQVAISKGAIEGLTRSLAAEFAPMIRVNAIAPSLTDTPLSARLLNTEARRTTNAERHPLKRIGRPEDIAEMVTFLLSHKCSWMTGQILSLDGGMSSIRL